MSVAKIAQIEFLGLVLAPLVDAFLQLLALVEVLFKVFIVKRTELSGEAHDFILLPGLDVVEERVMNIHQLAGVTRLIESRVIKSLLSLYDAWHINESAQVELIVYGQAIGALHRVKKHECQVLQLCSCLLVA